MHHQNYLYTVLSFLLYTDVKTTSHMFSVAIPEIPELFHNFGNCVSPETQSYLTTDTGKIWFDEPPKLKKKKEKNMFDMIISLISAFFSLKSFEFSVESFFFLILKFHKQKR